VSSKTGLETDEEVNPTLPSRDCEGAGFTRAVLRAAWTLSVLEGFGFPFDVVRVQLD
jgi:hypothetical protein